MARARKKIIEDESFDETEGVTIEIEPEKPDESPPIMVKTVERREYVAPMIPQASPPVQENAVTIASEPELPEADAIESLLREYGAQDAQWSMTVYRLPGYERDSNGSLKARKVLCGSQPFNEHFEQVIQELYAKPNKPNHFLVAVRRDSRIYRILPVLSIEPLPEAEREAESKSNQNNAIPAPVAIDPFAEMKRAIALVKQLQDVFPQPQASPQGEITTEQAVLKLVATDREAIKAITSRILPSEGGNGMPEWVTALLPIAAPLIGALTQKITQGLTAPAEPQQPSAPQLPPQTAEKYQHIIGRILYGIENGLAPDFVAEEIGTLCERDADLTRLCEPLITTPVTQIQAQISRLGERAAKIISTPQAADWLAALQAYFNEPESEGKNNAATANQEPS